MLFLLFTGIICLINPLLADDGGITSEYVLQRLKQLEKKVSVQDDVISHLSQTNAELRQTNAELGQMNEDMLAVNEELRKSNRMLLTMNTELHSAVDDKRTFKRFIMNEGPVAFTAGIVPKNVDHLNHQDTVKFETLITEIGGGYSNNSGVFVAPVSGLYLFSCSLMDHNGSQGLMVHGELVHNQRVIARIFAHAETGHRDQGAQTVVVRVQQGDQVWVRVVDNQDLTLGGELYSTFTGYLLLAQ